MSFENISIIAQLNIELTPLWIALFVSVGALMIAILMVIIGAIAESQSKSNKAVSDSHSQEKFLNESNTDSESSEKSSGITPESISKKMFQRI